MDFAKKRLAVVIIDTQRSTKGEYIPCIAIESKRGYYPTDWKWGKDKEIAEQLADDYNTNLGLTKEEAFEIILKSMRTGKERGKGKIKNE